MNLTIMRITMRGLFGRRRFLLLFPMPVLLVGLALLSDALAPSASDWAQPVLVGLGLAVVLPITALIVGTGVLGAEIDDGTIVHILAKPLPRREIILAKLTVAWLVTTVACAVPLFVAGVIAESTRLGLALAFGAAVGALAYSAFFLALSLLSRRPVLVGLLYVLLWEGLLGNFVAGTRVLSIQQYVVTIADKIAGTDLLTSPLRAAVAVVMPLVFVVGFTWLATDRLRSFRVAGETS
jgi:ABC-2 type transport system permease protein